MAVTASVYNHTLKKLVNKEVTLTTLKAELLSASATFNATHTTRTQVNNSGAYSVSGNGWTAGGETLASVAVTTVTTNDAKLDAADISVTATGGPIGPASAMLIYDDTDADAPLVYVDFGEAKQADDTKSFDVNFNAAGIITFSI